jgi:hypothetical protein
MVTSCREGIEDEEVSNNQQQLRGVVVERVR